jgi:GTP-binding protein EngB required for normal cell division
VRRRAGADTGSVVEALDTVVALGPTRVDDGGVTEAAALRRRIEERLGRGDDLTVVALAGGTGVGKSALLNALLGTPLAREGVRRPTTAVALAAAQERGGPTDVLLDWLEVPERHEVGERLPAGLVLLDLPDHDSVADAHRRTAARLARRVDVLVWVVDPVKYARADTHDGPLAELTEHADVLLVVLNRVDELGSDAIDLVCDDLQARLRAGGHGEAEVLTTSAATGEGIEDLRTQLTAIAARRTAAAARLVGDAAVLGQRLAADLEDLPSLALGPDRLVPALLEAVEADRAAVEAAQLTRRHVRERSRSPLARAVTAPLRRVSRAFGVTGGQRPEEPVRRKAVTERTERVVARELGVVAAEGRTHGALDRAVLEASAEAAPDLLDVVGSAGPTPPPSRWPAAFAVLRLVAELTALVGAAWLTALFVVDWLRLPALPTPDAIGAVPWPTALLLGGVVVRLLLGGLSRVAARRAGDRHGRRVARRIERGIGAVAEGRLLAPVRAEVADQDRLRAAIGVLASAGRAARSG